MMIVVRKTSDEDACVYVCILFYVLQLTKSELAMSSNFQVTGHPVQVVLQPRRI